VIRAGRNLLAVLVLATLGAALASSPALAASAAPAWRVESHAAPSRLVPGLTTGQDMYVVIATNIGGAATDGSPITISDNLPAGFTPQPNPDSLFEGALAFKIQNDFGGSAISPCTAGPPVTCTLSGYTVHSGERLTAFVPLQAPGSGPATVTNNVTVSGGGAATASATEDTPFDSDPVPFGIKHAESWFAGADGSAVTQAGAHPYSFHIGVGTNNSIQGAGAFLSPGQIGPAENPKDVSAKLPQGLVVNPTATPRCTEAQLENSRCPDSSAVGLVDFSDDLFGVPVPFTDPVYNMVAPANAPAELGFQAIGFFFFFHVLGNVDSANGYALKAGQSNITQFGGATDFAFDLWGDPSDPGHDHMRSFCGVPYSGPESHGGTCPVPPDPVPFLTMPSACSGPLSSSFTATSWQNQNPGGPVTASTVTTDAEGNPVGVSGCGSLQFEPTLKARPTTNAADSPSGLEVDLHVPQNNSQDTLATANLKKAVVTLPKGIAINPSAGNGLAACSSQQIGLESPIGLTPIRFSAPAPSCPDGAQVGSAEVNTPLLEDPLPGSVYIAAPYDNPFHSFLALYIVVNDAKTGVVIKLAGKVEADPQTGRLTATFDENPQLPFEDFKLDFFGGAGGTLRTPQACGTFATTSELTPWSAPDSGPPATPEDEYAISQSPAGSCVGGESEEPNAPSFDAGAVSPIAGEYSPFVVHLRRGDGTQRFTALSVSPPAGLVGKLAGTATCSATALASAEHKSGREEEANPSCPASSKVGTVVAGAGAGPAPYYARGNAYMSGPYKGAPLSVAIVTPATAGPFDLGTVVTRTALYVDPKTAKINAVSDPLPTILQGIPLDIRSVDLSLDKPNFTLNGTSCDPSSVDGQLTSALGAIASLSSRFQLGDCTALGFKPKLSLRLKGGTTRGKHPALTATFEPRAGDANLAAISVALPRSEFLDQSHIRTICTRVQFTADQCPAAAIYGTATATSPLFDYPLTGPVYLRSSDNKLPDLVLDLRGPASQPIRIEASGRTDSVKGGLRNTFEFVPDAPVTKFTLSLEGGKKGLLQNSTNICKEPNKATVNYTAHNGDALEGHPLIKVKCPKKARKGRKGHKHGHKSAQRG
jgi:hypothetical protein